MLVCFQGLTELFHTLRSKFIMADDEFLDLILQQITYYGHALSVKIIFADVKKTKIGILLEICNKYFQTLKIDFTITQVKARQAC